MKHWLRKNKIVNKQIAESEDVEVFGEIFNSNNDAPVRVRNVKEFVVSIIEESRRKEDEITDLRKQVEGLGTKEEELSVARLMLEQADLNTQKLKDEISRLREKLDEQKNKNQKLRDENNDLKLKSMIKRKRTSNTSRSKK